MYTYVDYNIHRYDCNKVYYGRLDTVRYGIVIWYGMAWYGMVMVHMSVHIDMYIQSM